MIETINELTLGQLTGGIALLAAGISVVVEITPIKLNPWSWLAKKLGRAINGEVLDKVDSMQKDFNDLRTSVDERSAKDARNRILRFGDECLHGEKHSKEHFDQILEDITEYETYCRDHHEFKNNKAVLTIGSIKSIYQQRLRDHDFL